MRPHPALHRDPALYATVALTVALCVPFARFVEWLGDEGVLLHGAERILRGERIYLDFFEILPPGGFLVVTAWMAIFGTSLIAARALAVLTIASIAALTFSACRSVSRSAALPVALCLAWTIASQGAWTVVNHHWLSTMLAMGAMVALASALGATQDGRVATFIAGALAGAGTMVTSNRGAAVCVASLALVAGMRRTRNKTPLWLLGCAVAPALCAAYLASQGALGAAVDDVFVFSVRRYTSIAWIAFGQGSSLQSGPLVALFPVMLFVSLAVFAGEWRSAFEGVRVPRPLGRAHAAHEAPSGAAQVREPASAVHFAFALVALATCFPRPDVAHIAFSAPLGLPWLAFGVTRMTSWLGPRWRHAGAIVVGAGCVLPLYAYALLLGDVTSRRPLRFERGLVVLGDGAGPADLAPALDSLRAALPADGFLFYPYDPMLPFLTGRRHRAAHDVFTPGYTAPEQYEATCAEAIAGAEWLILDRLWMDPQHVKAIWPAVAEPHPAEKAAFEAALQAAYEPAVRFGRFEVMRRRHDAPTGLCDPISP